MILHTFLFSHSEEEYIYIYMLRGLLTSLTSFVLFDRNIGFMEAFEASQEVNLQSGFHAGFRESESDAFRIGKMFGKLCASEALNGRESDEIKNLAKLVRVFLSDLQNSNGVDRKAPSLKEVEMKIDQAVTLENNNDEGNDND